MWFCICSWISELRLIADLLMGYGWKWYSVCRVVFCFVFKYPENFHPWLFSSIIIYELMKDSLKKKLFCRKLAHKILFQFILSIFYMFFFINMKCPNSQFQQKHMMKNILITINVFMVERKNTSRQTKFERL